MQIRAVLVGLLLCLGYLQCIRAYQQWRGVGRLHTRGSFANDLDILPYGVLQQLQGAAAAPPWRLSRQFDWSSAASTKQQEWRLQSPPANAFAHGARPKTLRRQQQWQQQQEQLKKQQQQQQQMASRRMPRLQRMHDNYYNVYDADGEHLLGLHYHNDALSPPQSQSQLQSQSQAQPQSPAHAPAPALATARRVSIAKSWNVAVAADEANGVGGGQGEGDGYADDWRPMVPPPTHAPAKPQPKLRSYKVRQQPATSTPTTLPQRDGRQVQHFWLQL